MNTVTNNIPSKISDLKKPRLPWISKDVCRYISWRDRLAKSAKKSGSLIDRQRFRKARNQASQIIKDAYKKYLNNVIGNVSDDPHKKQEN